jgi:hypothetical protein
MSHVWVVILGRMTATSTRSGGESLTVDLDGGPPITIRSELPGVLTWLEEMLAPGFSVRVQDDTALSVAIGAATVRNSGPTPEASLPCFALDTEVRRLPGRAVGSSFVLEDDHWGTRYQVAPGSVHISLSRPHARVRPSALRVVREMATVGALAVGGRIQLHASCLAWEGRCLVLAGPKRAGKTTLLARLAASTGAEIVANDRLILRNTAHGWQVTGVPTIVSVRPGTMRCLPDLFRTVPAVARPIDLTLREATSAAARFGVVTKPSQLSLSPAQLAHEVGSRLSQGGPLACLAVIGVEAGAGDFHVRRLSRVQAAETTEGVRYGARAQDEPTVFERTFATADREPTRGPLEHDLSTHDWVRVGVTERFLSSPGAPEKLLRTLLSG